MGAREGESPVVPGPCRTTRRCLRVGLFGMQPKSGGEFRPRLNIGESPIANKYPRGKDEKDFEKRVKECLKLSGGKRMETGDVPRLGVER
ncbi:unnamed protein product [Cuscuta epithymum]|uniref:Uncharacterized protein n=1 Tax=Cuscuta epithymum TaxID=186058 RepID=A0AAV0GLW0_9ASTE|nr:unnamed protein product [Cuscuta epithymum]